MTLNNFLTSGYCFSEEQYQLKSKFILMNSALFIIFVFISVLTLLLFIKQEFVFAVYNCIYLLIDVSFLYILRINKKYYKYILPVFPLISILLVTVAIIKYPTEQVRIAWFLVIIIFSFFLGGKKLGVSISAVIVAVILGIEYFVDTSLNVYTLSLAMVIILLGTVVVNLYEERDLKTRKRLHESNLMLEEKVKNEINKRILSYQKTNLKLQESAKKLEEQKNAYKQLAHNDMLTQLPNRIFFNDRLKHSIDKAKRNGTKIAVLFLDLDNFKEINDSLGHHVGDEVLKIVANRLKKCIRQSDTLARLGGDEFTLLLEDLNNVDKVGEITQTLIKTLSHVMYIGDHELYVTVSIGASVYPDNGEDNDTLLKCADSAMYSAKKEGNNLFHFYEKKMTDLAIERITLETSMRHGIERDEFLMYYQPIIDVKSSKFVGMEALLRWNHPELGIVTPEKFIHIAESSSIIIELGEKILDMVAEQLEKWYEIGFDPLCISVNISVKQLRHFGLIPKIEEILKKTHQSKHWLQLEITEGYAMQQLDKAVMILQRIRDLGVTLAIDDFGTGYSSLSYLKKLPINRLKIDKSFISDIPGNQEDEALVRAIVSMAHSMHLGVVAEGIESKVQEDFLLKVGCHTVQGYLYYKPMPADAIIDVFYNKKLKDENG